MAARAASRIERQRATAARTPAEIAEIMRAIRALVNALGQSARSIELRTGVTNAQLFILQQLERHDGLSINDLAALALTKQSTVSLVVSRLERDGLVRRARGPEDLRRVSVSLTPRARRLLAGAPEPPTSRVIAALHRLPSDRLAALADGLAALGDVLGASGEEPMMLFEERRGVGRKRPRGRTV